MRLNDSINRLATACVVVAGCLVVAWNVWPTVVGWHQQQLASKFTQRIAEASDDAVRVPIRQLARLGIPALEPLVIAAASHREAVAEIARQVVREKFATWQVQALNDNDFQLALPLKTLAAALADNIDRFGPQGKQWAEGLTLRILKLAEATPPDAAPTLLDDCSRVLAAVAPRGPRLRNVFPVAPLSPSAKSPRLSPPAMELDVLAVPTENSLRASSQAARQRVEDRAIEIPHHSSDDLTPRPRISAASDGSPPWAGVPQVTTPHHSAPPIRSSLGGLRTVESEVIDVPTPTEMGRQIDELREFSSRLLVERLSKVDNYKAGSIRAILRERGFVEAEFALAELLSSHNASDRLRMIGDLSVLSASSARRWLRWLLEDASADVRLRALTAMATTSDPQLFELARQMVVTDEDPRISKLASRIMQKTR